MTGSEAYCTASLLLILLAGASCTAGMSPTWVYYGKSLIENSQIRSISWSLIALMKLP